MSSTLATPLMQRTVCEDCSHLHRTVLGKPGRDNRGRVTPIKCGCCAEDVQQYEASLEAEQED